MKFLLGLTLATGLTACASSLTVEQRDNLVTAAILAIDDLNRQGINYIDATPETKNVILSGCLLGPIALAAAADIENAQKLTQACAVIKAAV